MVTLTFLATSSSGYIPKKVALISWIFLSLFTTSGVVEKLRSTRFLPFWWLLETGYEPILTPDKFETNFLKFHPPLSVELVGSDLSSLDLMYR